MMDSCDNMTAYVVLMPEWWRWVGGSIGTGAGAIKIDSTVSTPEREDETGAGEEEEESNTTGGSGGVGEEQIGMSR